MTGFASITGRIMARRQISQGGTSGQKDWQMSMFRRIAGTALVSIGLASTAMAQEDTGQAVSIELNAVKSNEASCTLIFVITNGHSQPIDKAVYETVLFDSAGQVDRLTLFDFGALPPDRPRVRQFTVSGLTCEGLDKVLINGAHTCDAENTTENTTGNACETGLKLRSRTDIEMIG